MSVLGFSINILIQSRSSEGLLLCLRSLVCLTQKGAWLRRTLNASRWDNVNTVNISTNSIISFLFFLWLHAYLYIFKYMYHHSRFEYISNRLYLLDKTTKMSTNPLIYCFATSLFLLLQRNAHVSLVVLRENTDSRFYSSVGHSNLLTSPPVRKL